MSWRTIVVTGIAKLDYKMDYLVVRKQNGMQRVHLSEIGMLIIESTSVSLTTTLLCELVKHKTKVIFCDEKHNPQSALHPFYGSHDTSAKIRAQVAWPSSIKESVWTEIVTLKIKHQHFVLIRRKQTEAAALLSEYLKEITFDDETNREGHAAKVYFNALFGKDFTRTSQNAINAALNYGYGILLSFFTREIVSMGYITQLGLFHDNMYNPFNLASDLMEPFRPLVDERVLDMEPDRFEHDEKMLMLDLFNSEVMIDRKQHYISYAVKIYCKSVFDALNNGDVSEILDYSYYEL